MGYVLICFEDKVWERQGRVVRLLDSGPAKKCLARGSGIDLKVRCGGALIEISGTF